MNLGAGWGESTGGVRQSQDENLPLLLSKNHIFIRITSYAGSGTI